MTHKTQSIIRKAPERRARQTFFFSKALSAGSLPNRATPNQIQLKSRARSPVGSRWPWRTTIATNHWQIMLHHIPGNCTHHYMLLVDGQPTSHKHCVTGWPWQSESEAEKQFALLTPRGPRVFMLFQQHEDSFSDLVTPSGRRIRCPIAQSK